MNLIVIQIVALLVTVLIGLMLALGRVHASTIVHRYEISRWMIVSAMGVYAVHYLLQILFGFRASGDDVGAVVNILFYAPVAYLLSFSIVNLLSSSRYLRRHTIFGVGSYSVILVTFLVGLLVKRSLHMGVFMYIMGVEFFGHVLYSVVGPFKEGRQLRSELENDTAGDLTMYNRLMRNGTLLLLCVGLMIPTLIFTHNVLFVVGLLFLLLLFLFSVNFLCLGFSLRPVADVLDTDEEPQHDGPSSSDASIQSAIDSWLSKGGFSNPDMSLGKLARIAGCTQTELGRFISSTYGATFRVWLSKLRLEEAKRMLIDKPQATIEVVAEDCGFTSRSYFQNLFKAETGFTPREWRFRNVRQ